MEIIIDLVIVAILLVNIIIGYKKGLINVIFSICAFLIAIIATLILYKPVSNIIMDKTNIDEKIKQMIVDDTKKAPEEKENKNNTEIQNYIENYIQNAADEAKSQATETIADAIAIKGVQVITGIILFVAIRIVLIALKFITQEIANLPIIKQFNELGGLIYGIAKGLIIIYIILTIAFFVISMGQNVDLETTINKTFITKFLYNNNIIVNYCLLGKNLL
mgnify:CR=1 FL=1